MSKQVMWKMYQAYAESCLLTEKDNIFKDTFLVILVQKGCYPPLTTYHLREAYVFK